MAKKQLMFGTAAAAELRKGLEQLAKAVERIEARDRKDEETKTYSEMEQAVNAAEHEFKLTPEGRQKMLDLMKERKIYDPQAAAALVVHKNPPEMTSGPSWAPHKTDFYGTAKADEAYASLHKDPMGFADDEIAKFLKDPAQYAAEAA